MSDRDLNSIELLNMSEFWICLGIKKVLNICEYALE